MSNTLNILKGIKPLFKRGETFYYANRNTKQAEKCTVVDWVCQYPMAYIAKKTKHREKLLNVIMILGVLHRSKKPMMMLKSRRIE